MNQAAAVPGRLTFLATRRGAAVWGLVFGVVVVGSARGFVAAYPTPAERQRLAASLGGNAGLRALFGVARRLDTVGGFTAWRSLGTLTIVGGVWAVLASTRALRGEEDEGRWDLVLAGPVSRRAATCSALTGLGLSLAVLWAATAAVSLLGGSGIAASSYLFLALALAATPALFLAVGSLAAQLASDRRQAAALAGGFFGACYIVRLVADSGSGTGWLRWATPLGWVEELRPMSGSRPAVLLPLAGLTAVFVGLTVAVADRRDLGAGLLPARDTAPARTTLLTGPLGLAVRLVRAGALAWSLGLGVMAFVFGLVAKSVADAAASSNASQFFSRLGARRVGPEAYLGVTFLVLGAVLALVAAGHASAARDEEASGRLDHLLVRPVTRARWLASRATVVVGEAVVLAVVVGVAGWAGTAVGGSAVPAGLVVAAGVNLVPAALLVLGAGLLLLGFAPRAVASGAYGLVGWSFLIEFVASLLGAPRWLLDLSVFHHVALAPAVPPNWVGGSVLVGLGLVAAAIGAIALDRRDVVPA